MVEVWDMTKRTFLRTLQTSEADMVLRLVYFSPDGKAFVTIMFDHRYKIPNIKC